jgi:hypothetical protein
MTRWQIVKGAAKGAWKTWRNKRQYERWNKMSNEVKVWDASKTASKAKAAAIPVGVAAALVAVLRGLLGDKLPWGSDQDAWVAGILMTALSYVFTYFRDKKNHGGFGPMTPDQLDAQTAFFNKMHADAEAARAAKAQAEKEQPK